MAPRGRSASAPPRLETQTFLEGRLQEFNENMLIEQQKELAAQNAKESELRAQLRAQSNSRIAIARSYKNYLQRGREERAATTLQAGIRGMLVRKQFLAQQEAATTLQAIVRGRIARQEFEQTKQAVNTLQSLVRRSQAQNELQELKDRRDAATTIQSLVRRNQAQGELQKLKDKRDADVAELRRFFGSGQTWMTNSSTYVFDKYLATLTAQNFDGAVQVLDEYVQKNDWANYGKKLDELREGFKAQAYLFKNRLSMDKTYEGVIQDSGLLAKAEVATLTELYAKLPTVPSSEALWNTLVDLCSAVTQNINEILETIRQLSLTYRPPRQYTRRATVPVFHMENSNSWDINPVKWHPDIVKYKTTMEASAGSNKLTDLRDGSLKGRTVGRAGTKVVNMVMHEHLTGNEGLGFCYLREKDGSVTPWVLDYSSSRGGKKENDYKWERGGKGTGDPVVALPKQDPEYV